jgi:hypothetical protein
VKCRFTLMGRIYRHRSRETGPYSGSLTDRRAAALTAAAASPLALASAPALSVGGAHRERYGLRSSSRPFFNRPLFSVNDRQARSEFLKDR